MRPYALLVGLALLLGFFGCSSDDNEDPSALDVRGCVTDGNGQAVPGAIIQLAYRLDGLPDDHHEDPVLDDNDLGECRIPVSVEEAGMVHVWVTRFDQSEVIASVIHGEMSPGSYTLFWNKRDTRGMLVGSGVYDIHTEIDGARNNRHYLVNNSYEECWYLSDLCCASTTDDEGWFSINQDCLAFNCITPDLLHNEDGTALTGASFQRSIRLWVMHDDYYRVCMDSVYVDPASGVDLQIDLTLLPYGR